MQKITKDQLVAEIAEGTDIPKATVLLVLAALCMAAEEALKKGQPVTLPGLGVLDVSARAARRGTAPGGGEYSTPARRVPVFRAAKSLRDAVS